MTGNLNGKRIVITGGGKNLGRSLTLALTRAGAEVAIMGRDRSGIDQTAKLVLEDNGTNISCFVGDITNNSDVRAFQKQVKKELGGINVLINNAAVWKPGLLLDVSENDVNQMIDSSIKGPIWLARAFWKDLIDNAPSNIINITTAGARPSRSNASPVYVAAKYGLAGFTDSLRRLAIKHHIYVTELLPGSVASELSLDSDEKDLKAKYGESKAHPKDIVDAILYVLTRTSTAMVEDICIPSVGDWEEDFARY